ncbi:serine protease 58-like [Rhynchonycteris naso]
MADILTKRGNLDTDKHTMRTGVLLPQTKELQENQDESYIKGHSKCPQEVLGLERGNDTLVLGCKRTKDLSGRSIDEPEVVEDIWVVKNSSSPQISVAVTSTSVTPVPAQAKLAQQFNQMSTKTTPTFLIFLNSEYEPCLGILIHKQWVLTAAHCFLPFLEINIAASEEGFRNKMGNLKARLTVQHPNFTQDSAEHDLMLIKLTHPLKLNNQVKPVALPNTMDDRRGDTCTVSGWGWTWKNSNTDPDIQLNKTVSWFSNEHCQESPVRKIPVKVTENMFCAGSSLESTHLCKELAAAPILCQNQLHGILSWSDGCVLKGDTGYYTKVSHYTDWILSVIQTN